MNEDNWENREVQTPSRGGPSGSELKRKLVLDVDDDAEDSASKRVLLTGPTPSEAGTGGADRVLEVFEIQPAEQVTIEIGDRNGDIAFDAIMRHFKSGLESLSQRNELSGSRIRSDTDAAARADMVVQQMANQCLEAIVDGELRRTLRNSASISLRSKTRVTLAADMEFTCFLSGPRTAAYVLVVDSDAVALQTPKAISQSRVVYSVNGDITELRAVRSVSHEAPADGTDPRLQDFICEFAEMAKRPVPDRWDEDFELAPVKRESRLVSSLIHSLSSAIWGISSSVVDEVIELLPSDDPQSRPFVWQTKTTVAPDGSRYKMDLTVTKGQARLCISLLEDDAFPAKTTSERSEVRLFDAGGNMTGHWLSSRAIEDPLSPPLRMVPAAEVALSEFAPPDVSERTDSSDEDAPLTVPGEVAGSSGGLASEAATQLWRGEGEGDEMDTD